MEKVIYALWRRPDHDLGPIDKWLTGDVMSHLSRRDDVLGARVLVEAPEYAIPAKSNPHGELCGLVSAWLPTYQDRGTIDDMMRDGPAHEWHAWLVCESVPTGYGADLTWPMGQRSPGLTQLTLFDKPSGLDEARFYRLWHVSHRKTTADVHPLWCYVRNEVVRPLTLGGPPLRGIVYQAVRDPQDFLDPDRMYSSHGDAARFEANTALVRDETSAFINFDTIQNQRMHEYLVRVVST
jgi:hypothetical protein